MKVKVLFFASLRESLGVSGEDLSLPGDTATVDALRRHLAARGGEWARLAADANLRYAVNQAMAQATTGLKGGDEVAFFPPVTGG